MEPNHDDITAVFAPAVFSGAVRAAVSIVLLLGVAAAFARFDPRPPVIDGRTARPITPAEIHASGNVVIFLIDTPISPDYVGSAPDVALHPASHGSMVARVLRHHVNAAVIGLPAEDAAGKMHRDVFLDALRTCLQFAQENPKTRVLLNISLAFSDHDPEVESLLEKLSRAKVAIAAAAGNDASDIAVYPAAYRQTAAVASAERSGKSPHSNYGEHIEIAASGDASLQEITFLPYHHRRRIIETRGTSYAAPRLTAALAYVLQKRPDWDTCQALEFVLDTAIPIDDGLYRDGKLGAGYLDMARTKARIHRPYFWFHRFLPLLTFSVFGALSLVIIVLKRLPGLFIALLLWLCAVPGLFLLLLGLGRFLRAIEAGLLDGDGPYMLAALGGAFAGLLFLRFRTLESLRALLPPAAAGLLMGAAEAAPGVKAAVLALAPPAGAALWEWRTRKVMAKLDALRGIAGTKQYCMALAAACERYYMPRIKAKIRELALAGPADDSIIYFNELMEEGRSRKGARQILDILEQTAQTQIPAEELPDSVDRSPADM